MSLRVPKTLAEFIAIPTAEEWNAELARGWRGSDGASLAPDYIVGVQIGKRSDDFDCSHLPANLHDYFYAVARRMAAAGKKLPERWRREVDKLFRTMCRETVLPRVTWWQRGWARFMIGLYYSGVRHGAAWAWE